MRIGMPSIQSRFLFFTQHALPHPKHAGGACTIHVKCYGVPTRRHVVHMHTRHTMYFGQTADMTLALNKKIIRNGCSPLPLSPHSFHHER